MGFFGSGDKNTSTNNYQTGASESAQLATGAQAQTGKDDAIVLGGVGNKNTLGDGGEGQAIVGNAGVTLGGYANKNNLGGEFSATGNASITVNNSDGEGAAQVAQTFASTVEKLSLEKSKQATADAIALKTGSEDEKKSKSDNSLIFWGVGLLVTVLAAIAFSRSHKKSA